MLLSLIAIGSLQQRGIPQKFSMVPTCSNPVVLKHGKDTSIAKCVEQSQV
jgi:hypothetical protein